MSDAPMEIPAGKTALKNLRAARKEQIAAATARMKEQRRAVKAIKAHLEKAGLTVPEMAAATGLPASEVLYYVATLKKYGEILEGPKDGGYYRYRLGQVPAPAAEIPVVTSPEQCAAYEDYTGVEPLGAAEFCHPDIVPAQVAATTPAACATRSAPVAVAQSTVTDWLLPLLRLTVNTAFTEPELPSVTVTSLMLICGAASSSVIVPMPWLSLIDPLPLKTRLLRSTV
mgnify:CR=1 FL=1